MLGRSLENKKFNDISSSKDEIVLSLRNFNGHGFKDINLDLFKGEI